MEREKREKCAHLRNQIRRARPQKLLLILLFSETYSSSKRNFFPVLFLLFLFCSCCFYFVPVVSAQRVESIFGSVLYGELYKGSVLLEVSVCVRGGYAVRSYVGERVGTILTLYFLKKCICPYFRIFVAKESRVFSRVCVQ